MDVLVIIAVLPRESSSLLERQISFQDSASASNAQSRVMTSDRLDIVMKFETPQHRRN